jgi:hypothetical protein
MMRWVVTVLVAWSAVASIYLIPFVCDSIKWARIHQDNRWGPSSGEQQACRVSDAYTQTVQQALRLLAQVDADGADYLSNHPVRITEMDGSEFGKCNRGHHESVNAVTTPDSNIFINVSRSDTVAMKAAVVSHEVVHVEHGDRSHPRSQHSLLRHILIHEEGEAHWAGLLAAARLGTMRREMWLEPVVYFPVPLEVLHVVVLVGGSLVFWHLVRVSSARQTRPSTRA